MRRLKLVSKIRYLKNNPQIRFISGLLVFIWITGCSASGGAIGIDPSSTVVPLPPPESFVTKVPDAELTAQAFLDAWNNEDYAGMYAMLSPSSQQAISQDDFIKYYRDVAVESTLVDLKTEILEKNSSHDQAEVIYNVIMHTALIGDLDRQTKMTLIQDQGQWKINWDTGMVLPELAGGNYLRMDRDVPARGNIYDRKRQPIGNPDRGRRDWRLA
jgi:hypothetical protein